MKKITISQLKKELSGKSEKELADEIVNLFSTRLLATSQDFVVFAQQVITGAQKKKLRKLINFRFKRHPRYNLPAHRLKIIEDFIQQRVHELLLLQTK